MVAPANTSFEGVEHTLGGSSINEIPMVDYVPNAMTLFPHNGYPQQVDEVPAGILFIEEVPEETEGSKSVTEFTEDSCPPQFHQFWASLLTLRKKAMIVQEGILQQNQELESMTTICVESTTKLTHVGE